MSHYGHGPYSVENPHVGGSIPPPGTIFWFSGDWFGRKMV